MPARYAPIILLLSHAPYRPPKLTLYRDGFANLNGEANRALPTDTVALLLLPHHARHSLAAAAPAHPRLLGHLYSRLHHQPTVSRNHGQV